MKTIPHSFKQSNIEPMASLVERQAETGRKHSPSDQALSKKRLSIHDFS
ncbi:hypothetical protein [Azohydromonas lata]|nr:hypothetical protein [Azohydromonas lata]